MGIDRSVLVILSAILLGSILIRLIDPIGASALGQTDAYAHLQFLNDAINQGWLRHPAYPPGYYLMLAVPARLFGWDPYLVARFAGAVFGAGMVLAVWLLAKSAFGIRAAIWSAFFVGVFPLFYLLQKTGIGMYPNQIGFIMMPLALLSWDRLMRGSWICGAGFVLLLIGLAVSVPIMLIDLLAFLAIDTLIRSLKGEIPRVGVLLLLVIVFAPIPLIATLFENGSGHFRATAIAAASLPAVDESGLSILWALLVAYLQPERPGLGSLFLSSAALIVGILLFIFMLILSRRNPAARMIALWSLFTWAQTVYGVCQFPLYMRAGWFLLMSAAILGGWLADFCMTRFPGRFTRLAPVFVLASFIFAIIDPPKHNPHLSPAENDLVSCLRAIQKWSKSPDERNQPPWIKELSEGAVVYVWSRGYNDFPGSHGDPVHALLEEYTNIVLKTVNGTDHAQISFETSARHILLMDDPAVRNIPAGAMEIVYPALVKGMNHTRSRLMSGSIQLREAALLAEANGWQVLRWRQPEGLDLWLLSFGNSQDRD
jgi:hypothetical protein